MDNSTATAGQLPATLEAKITAYEDTLLEQLRTACNRFGISGRTETQIEEDLRALLRYKSEPIHLDRDGAKELVNQADFYRSLYWQNLPIALIAQTYADIERISDIINTLRQTAKPSQERQLVIDFSEAFTAGTPWAQAEILRRYTWLSPDNDMQYFVARESLALFYIHAIYFSGATAEELLQVEPRGLTLTEKEREAAVQEAMRAAAEFDYRVKARPSTANDAAEEISGIEIPEERSPSKPTKDGMADDTKPAAEAAYIDEKQQRQRLLLFRQSYVKLLSRPLPISFAAQPNTSTEPIRIKDLMQLSDLFKEQAQKFDISETRIYQCLDALQLITQADGDKHNIRGYDYYFYDTTLAGFIRLATGSDARISGDAYGDFWTALWILSNVRISVDEEIIKGSFEDKDGKKRQITERRDTFIQLLNVPIISVPKKPEDRLAKNINITLEVHSFVKDGRTRPYIMDKQKRKLFIKQSPYHKITEAEEKLARKLFKRKDTGIRFYYTLLYCQHKEEDALLEQVFDYQQKKERAAAEAYPVKDDKDGGKVKKQTNELTEEERKKIEEAYKQKELSILKHKGQDRDSLERMFKAAKDNGILDSYSRYEVKERLKSKPTAIWKWERHQPSVEDGAEA
jgi:hypothetical protein